MPRRAWQALSEDERRQLVVERGGTQARFLRLIANDGQLAYPPGCACVGVWELPEDARIEVLQEVLDAGWHDFFYEINARGTADPPVEVLSAAGWKRSSNGQGDDAGAA